MRFTPAVNATLITGLLATLLIREPMSRRQIAGAVLGLVGVISLISGGSLAFPQAARGNPGDLIVLGAVGLWALYSVLGRQVMRGRSALSATAFSAFLGLPLLLPATFWELRAFALQVSPRLLLAILYIGLAPTVIAFLSRGAQV